jgi:hypothetical protein
VLNPLPKVVTAFGILCITVGVAWGFVDLGTHFRFRFFSEYAGLFLITLVVGILLSSGGALAWARHFSKRKKLEVAGCIFAMGLVAFTIAPNNVHGPGMLLILVAICAGILSLVLAMMAVVGGYHAAR